MYSKSTMLTLAVLLSVCFVGVFTACPYGFTLHGSSCFLVVGLNSTWIVAKKYCDVWGGDLAVAESQTEQQLEAVLQHSNWAAGQPDNDVDGLTNNCLEMIPDVHWNDLDCNAKRNFICKASKEWKPKPVVG